MIKIDKNISSFSTYSCQPKTKDELIEIINKRIIKEGNKCDLNDIDVSLIEDMSYLFSFSSFSGDISKWNVSNVKDMSEMFSYSTFNKPIGNWNVSNAKDMSYMFDNSKFNKDISNWDVSNVQKMCGVFQKSKFNRDISNWKINKDCDTTDMFNDCPIKEEYKPKSLQS